MAKQATTCFKIKWLFFKLLDKSPGNPVEVQLPMPSTHPLSIAPLSPVKVANTATRSTEENKENRDTSFYQPSGITSEVAMNVIQFLNQQLQGSLIFYFEQLNMHKFQLFLVKC